MNRFFLFTIVFLLSFSTSPASTLSSEALNQAEQFTTMIDKRDYLPAYEGSSNLLHISTPLRKWVSVRKQRLKLLGTVLERKLVTLKARDSYPGLPDGDYLIIYFEARTEKKEKAAEVLLLKETEDGWKICSYSIR